MKAGCPVCKTGGDSKLCTCLANCMYPSCQWKVVSEPKPTFRVLTPSPGPLSSESELVQHHHRAPPLRSAKEGVGSEDQHLGLGSKGPDLIGRLMSPLSQWSPNSTAEHSRDFPNDVEVGVSNCDAEQAVVAVGSHVPTTLSFEDSSKPGQLKVGQTLDRRQVGSNDSQGRENVSAPLLDVADVPQPFGAHVHSPPSYGPDCDCDLCRFYTEMARNNPPAWPDPIEHRTQGIHYWGDTHLRKAPGPPLSLGAERQDRNTVQATL